MVNNQSLLQFAVLLFPCVESKYTPFVRLLNFNKGAVFLSSPKIPYTDTTNRQFIDGDAASTKARVRWFNKSFCPLVPRCSIPLKRSAIFFFSCCISIAKHILTTPFSGTLVFTASSSFCGSGIWDKVSSFAVWTFLCDSILQTPLGTKFPSRNLIRPNIHFDITSFALFFDRSWFHNHKYTESDIKFNGGGTIIYIYDMKVETPEPPVTDSLFNF